MKKQQITTPAMSIFKDNKILNKRPEGMSFEDYKVLRKIQSKVIKQLTK